MNTKMILKELRIVLQRLSEERIEEIRNSSGRANIEDLEEDLSDNSQPGNSLLPKKIGRFHYCPQSECKYSSVSRRAVVDHIRIHTGEKPYVFGKERQKDFKCSICGRSYLNKTSLNSHMVQNHDGNPKKFNCRFCDKHFRASKNLTKHMRFHIGEKPFVCKLCPFKSSHNSNLHEHIKRIHTKDKPYKCFICSKGFPVKGDLVIHSKVHTGEKINTCSQCQKTFGYKKSLNRHMRIHTGEKPYTCTFCNKNFRHSHTLIFHIQTHTKETRVRKFECSECESKFVSPYALKNHSSIHTGEKPFTCKFCGKTFRTLAHSRFHEKSHTESFECDECDKKYSSKSNLVSHKQRAHIRQEVYGCEFCGKQFYDKKYLVNHIVTHTKTKPLELPPGCVYINGDVKKPKNNFISNFKMFVYKTPDYRELNFWTEFNSVD